MATFTLWGSLTNFFFTSSGPISNAEWAAGNETSGSYPLWVDDETAASTYVAGQPAT